MAKTIIGILGKPLSGKDTVAEALRSMNSGIATISMGDVVREVKAMGPSHRFWDLLHDSIEVVDNGGIAPDEPIFRCITQLIDEQFRQGKDVAMWIGGPRSEQQVVWLDVWAAQNGYRDQFLHIDVPDGEVYARINHRLDHGRADDRADVVAFRLSEYERVTKPAVDRLSREGRIAVIHGVGERSRVVSDAIESLQFPLAEREITLPMMARR